MDSPSSSVAQLTSELNIQQHHNASQQYQMQSSIQQHDNTSGQFQMQSTTEIPCTRSEQSQTQPETACVAALEAKIASLQTELDLLKSTKPQDKLPNLYDVIYENDALKEELEKARQCINFMLDHIVKGKDEENAKLRSALRIEEEKEIDRKGKKVAEVGEKRKGRSLICFTKKGTDEVLDVLPFSEDSDNSDEEEELQDEEEDDVAQLKTFLKMTRSEELGSSSKTGSGSVEVDDMSQSKSVMDCGLSNGEVEKLSVLDKITSRGKKLYGPNYNEGSKLAMSGESGSSSCQTGLPSDPIKSKFTTESPEILKLNENEANLTHRKRKWDIYLGSEEDMLCSLTSKPEMLLEAVCALSRLERKKRFGRSKGMHCKGLPDSEYQKLMEVATFLMEGNLDGPNKKTTEELENNVKGGLDFCAQLVGTYSTQLFHIFSKGSDLHFC